MLVQVEIASFALDPSRNLPIIILRELNGDRALPVPIGPLEASAIAIESLNVTPDKPLTIDLVKLVLDQLGGKLKRVVIHDILEQSLLARLQIVSGNSVTFIDCRPCDAIALALRCKAGLFVDDRLLDLHNSREQSEQQKLRHHIHSIETIDFGKYFLE